MNNRRCSISRSRLALTLVEVMVALSILVILAAGVFGAVLMVRADAENNLYESAAQNVAISFLEQLKSFDYGDLIDPPTGSGGSPSYTFIIGFGQELEIPLDTETVVEVPIVSNESGTATKILPVTVTIQVEAATTLDGFWLQTDYRWEHPTSGREYSGDIRGFRSEVSTY